MSDCICGPDHDCRSTGCDEACEACCGPLSADATTCVYCGCALSYAVDGCRVCTPCGDRRDAAHAAFLTSVPR